MNDAERIRHLKHRLQTRAGTAEIGTLVHALAKLGVYTVVTIAVNGDRHLATVSGRTINGNDFEMRFERLRSLTPTEADVAREHGAGYFESPRPVETVPTEHVQG